MKLEKLGEAHPEAEAVEIWAEDEALGWASSR